MNNLHLSHIRLAKGSILPDESKLRINIAVIDRNLYCVLVFNTVPDIRANVPVENIAAMIDAIKECNGENKDIKIT